MPVVAASGALLAWWMAKAAPGLFSTRFGHLLAAKTALFASMLAVAVFVTRFVGPRLAARARTRSASAAARKRVAMFLKPSFSAFLANARYFWLAWLSPAKASFKLCVVSFMCVQCL